MCNLPLAKYFIKVETVIQPLCGHIKVNINFCAFWDIIRSSWKSFLYLYSRLLLVLDVQIEIENY